MVSTSIAQLVSYAESVGLIGAEDRIYSVNRLLEILHLSDYTEPAEVPTRPLSEILSSLVAYAVSAGLIEEGVTAADLFDTKLMGALMPRPSEVIARFRSLCAASPKAATDWYYKLSGDSNYIRRDRIAKDMKWTVESPYGTMDITVNLSKPEKDPKAIAAAKLLKPSGYPKCSLCKENEGYAGRPGAAARQNHRILPLVLGGEASYLQYSPYVYYNEHCIVLGAEHVPMAIGRKTFEKLLDFVSQFPHYFIGSNADLPIVGGSILSHDHFQGGNYEFAMAKAPIETPLSFVGYEDVEAGIVRWPMSVIRLRSCDPSRLVSLSDRILAAWRGYTDEAVVILAETDGEKHNTITPIARRRGEAYEMDLVLRNNLCTAEHPMGLYHPHAELHHIKKENIGLIEVMGLAVLPARLKVELSLLAEAMVGGRPIEDDERIAKHAVWVRKILAERGGLNADNVDAVLKEEVGKVFVSVLEDAGVFKRTEQGRAAFARFVSAVNA